MSDSLRPHGLQHTRLVCQLPTPRVCSDSDAHQVGDAIQPSHPVIPFFLCLQSFPASGPFLMSQFFTSGGQISELQFQHHSLNECSGLISFRKDWLDLLAVQETIKSLLQHHKESWVLKNWCFWTVVLEKTLNSFLDSKEIQPVLPKGKSASHYPYLKYI